MGFTINTYDETRSTVIASEDAGDDYVEADKRAFFRATELHRDGQEIHLTLTLGTATKWITGYRMVEGEPLRLTKEVQAKLEAEESSKRIADAKARAEAEKKPA